jgi:DNA-binding protein H-NS
MPKTLAQIRKQIDTLTRQAELIQKRELAGVIARIREAIEHYGLTAADLGFGQRSAKKLRVVARKSVSKARYRHEDGRTWTGHGRKPKWFIDALAAGREPEDLAI